LADQLAKPFASETNTFPEPGEPPAIFNVPAISVFPDDAVILNLSVFTATSPVTPKVLDN